jgi:hypothetical protein
MTGVFEGVGTLQFSPDNKHAYAYSGEIGVGGPTVTLLTVKAESEYLCSEIQIMNGTTSNEDFKYVVYFNDVVVALWHFLYASTIHQSMPNTLHLTIPPFTTVKVTAENETSSTERNHTAVLTAKVKGAIQQIDLEAVTDGSKWDQ